MRRLLLSAWTGLNVSRCGTAHFHPCAGVYAPYASIQLSGAPVYTLQNATAPPGFMKLGRRWFLVFPDGTLASNSSAVSAQPGMPPLTGWSHIDGFCCTAPVITYCNATGPPGHATC